MKKNVQKNRMMFFGGTIAAVIALFIFSAAQVHAYAISTGTGQPLSGGSGTGDYDFGNSLQNLISPFTGFVNSLKWNNNTTINTNGTPGSTWPTVNLTPVVESTAQNFLSQWLGEFDNWFHSVTGIDLSGILVALLNLFSWALGLAQQVVNWLLGLFH